MPSVVAFRFCGGFFISGGTKYRYLINRSTRSIVYSRLKTVRDADWKTVESYTYHYKE